LATEAGIDAFRAGGNAIDAAIAAAAVLTVVYPHNVALGGDLIALVRTPDGDVRCINSSGWAGRHADASSMRARYGHALPVRGAASVTVPGGVRGWQALRRYGSRLTWDSTLRPAQRAAKSGVPLAPSVAGHLVDSENVDLFAFEDFDRVFRPDGRILRAGALFRQPQLAETLAQLIDDGADAFYTGALAERTVQFLGSHGSSLTIEDLAEFQPETTTPVGVPFRDLTVMTSPPNSQGFLLLRALRAIDALELADPLGEDLGMLMRIFHRGNLLRSSSLADPRHTTVDVDFLTGGDLRGLGEVGVADGRTALVPQGDTVGVAAADSDGYAVSLIQSVYHAFGSGLIDPVSGILFHNRGTAFSLNASSPNVIAARKRPAHTLMPAMTTRDGQLRHVLSTMGGQGQPQIIGQLLLRAIGGASAESAVAAARAVVGRQSEGSNTDTVSVEADIDTAARKSLGRSGLCLMEVAPHTEALGQANVVFAEATGAMTTASDPRSDGAAVVAHHPRHRWQAADNTNS
jgi:gamma-glutamyltranspeptidase/glutathione hydrolase